MPGQSSEAASTRALYNQSQELEGLQRVFDGIDKNNDKKVDVDEMHDTIRRLGYKCSKKEVADMMWEVDEDADGALEWSEFKLMCLCTISGPLVAGAAVEYLASSPVVCRYQRVRADKSGWEPRKLFTMIEFMMHDKDGSGTIDADECTQILYRRYSPAEVDAKVKEFMSHDTDGASMDAAEISFSEYVAMEKASLEELMKSHPTFRYSRGIVEDTRAEIRRAMKGTTRAH
uniref:EF-hand domain-containing protein n=1 Tax=Emiliania huxleyi TaxID=2903 RepID=A0A7S3W2B6_EMIHU